MNGTNSILKSKIQVVNVYFVNLYWNSLGLLSLAKVYSISDPVGLKLLARLRVGFSSLREDNLKHNFNDKLNPPCSCSIQTKSSTHYFLHHHFYNVKKIILVDDLRNIGDWIPALNDDSLIKLHLHYNDLFDNNKSWSILMCTIMF